MVTSAGQLVVLFVYKVCVKVSHPHVFPQYFCFERSILCYVVSFKHNTNKLIAFSTSCVGTRECEYSVWRCRFPWSWLEINATWRWSVWWPKSRASASPASGTPAPSWRPQPRARSTSTRWPHTHSVQVFMLPGSEPDPDYIQSGWVQVGSI